VAPGTNALAKRTHLHPDLRRCSSVGYLGDILPPHALHLGRRLRQFHRRICASDHYVTTEPTTFVEALPTPSTAMIFTV